MKNNKQPLALFDALEHIKNQTPPNHLSSKQHKDFSVCITFLKSYTGSIGTFNSYRREVERLLHWCWMVAKKTLQDIKRDDIESFVHFCQNPPKTWIGIKKAPRFINKNDERVPNPEWCPFVVTLSKASHRAGEQPIRANFDISSNSIKEILAILSTFYNFMLQDEYVYMNPVALIRQKSKFIRKNQGQSPIRRLSELQWEYVITTAQKMAEENPDSHERTLFIISALYAMYLRISELTASKRWIPVMSHFHRDNDGNWWFTTVGKGNKERQIAVSNAMLKALKRWREYLGLSILPSPADNSLLIPRTKGNGPITNTSYVRKIVQHCFDKAMNELSKDGFREEAESLIEATVHWLRHTGISDDVKHRPREHVRDDAGHSSGATTDKYIDIEPRERHQSAKNKPIMDEN